MNYLNPPAVAKLLGVKPTKVLTWIRSGELAAINVAEKRGGRPRWRIAQAALDAFLSGRTSRPVEKPTRKRKPQLQVTEYFV